jgi:hypothetical protein
LRKNWFFKTHKNSYTRLICITDREYGGHDKKYEVSVSFCHKLMIFCKIEAKTYGFW